MNILTTHRAEAYTHGWLESVSWRDGRLFLAGSALAPEGNPVDSFLAFAGDHPLLISDIQLGLPSPYVLDLLPHPTPNCGNAGFLLQAEDKHRQFNPASGRLFAVLPRVGPKHGHLLLRVERSLIPLPTEQQVATIGEYFIVGQEFLPYLIQLGSLQPCHDILDIGCGLGRMAYSLAYYLLPSARYEGFDLTANNIDFATHTISTRFSNFHFALMDVYNAKYNPFGTLHPSTFVFPYETNSFDFVLIASVFTHMLPDDICHYLQEITRVLRPGGRVLVTCFLLNDESRLLITNRQSRFYPLHKYQPGCWVESPEAPETGIAYDSSTFLQYFDKAGLTIHGHYPGAWCGRRRFRSYQDLSIFVLPQ